MVDDVDSVVVGKKKPSIWLLLLGIVGVIIAISLFATGDDDIAGFGVIPLLIGVVFFAVFFLWRRRALILTVSGSPLASIGLSTLGRDASQLIDDFINQFFLVKATRQKAEVAPLHKENE